MGILPFSESRDILKNSGLEIDPKTYYNLRTKELSRSLNPHEEALLLLRELESRDVHLAVKEQYVLDEEGKKKDRVILCIAWWIPEQIRMARRFVADMLAQTDGTFNTNEKRLLLQCFVGIDNTGKTFQFLQAFSTAESAEIIRFLLKVLEDHFFYDCPGFAVLMGDFGSGLSAGFAQKAVQDIRDAKDAREKEIARKGKQKQWEPSPDKLQLQHYPLLTAPIRPEYELDSQTIIVDSDLDWVKAVQPTVIGVNATAVILQFCTWHAAEAIKRKLIASGYRKERRNQIVDLIWKWITASTVEKLNTARNQLIFALDPDEKEYLVGYYQPKEPQFCHAYTSQYRNLGATATQRIEKNHHIISAHLHKNLSVSDAIFRICGQLDSLAIEYERRLEPSRISNLRLFDRTFFSLVVRRVTLFCLEICSTELLKAKELYDEVVAGKKDDLFDPKVGCKELCQLPLRYQLPCRHWMLYFYGKNEPIPINLFHPRWLIDGPSVLHTPWQIHLDNYDYSKDKPIDNRHIGDRFERSGEQLIIDTALGMVERHKNLPPGEKEAFALTFKKMGDSLNSRHDERLERLETLPRRLPDPIIQPKVTFVPGRKRALTGREAADLQEKEEARRRRRAQIAGEKQTKNDARQAQAATEASQRWNEVVEEYYQPDDDVISISSNDDLKPSGNEEPEVDVVRASDTDEFPDIDDILSQRKPSTLVPTEPSLSRPGRERKPTSKQASQNRHEIEKQELKKVQLKRKPKTVDTTQLEEFELPFHSSQ